MNSPMKLQEEVNMDRVNYLFSNTDLRKLILPLVFEQTLAITVGMADTMMISSVGEAVVSGVSLVDMLNVLIFGVLSALATGGAVVASQNLGAGKGKDACKSAKQLLVTTLVFGMAIFLWPLSFVFPNMLRACNDVRYPMVISIFSMFAFRIGLSIVLGIQMELGAIGVWYAMLADWVFRSACFILRYVKSGWKKTMHRLNA